MSDVTISEDHDDRPVDTDRRQRAREGLGFARHGAQARDGAQATAAPLDRDAVLRPPRYQAAVMMGVVVLVVGAHRECERAGGHTLPWPPTALRFLDTVLAWVKACSEPNALGGERACEGLGLARLGASLRDWAHTTATRKFVPRERQVPFMRVVVARVGAHRERERAAGRPLPWPPTELGVLDGALTMVMALAGPNPFEGERKAADTVGTPGSGTPSPPP